MANGHGGRRPGAGRKRKNFVEQTPPLMLEESVAELLNSKVAYGAQSTSTKKMAHELAYVKQELEFIKKIILASIEGKPKC